MSVEMSVSNIERLIFNDELNEASSLINSVLKNSKNVNQVAANVLKVLSGALAKSSRCQKNLKSESKHIFKLAEACCKVISKTWECDHCAFMRYIYHICKYLILKDDLICAKKLTLYFAALKEWSNIPWNEEQKTVLNNTLKNFVISVFVKRNPNLFGSGQETVVSWWTFILTVSELDNFQNLTSTFPAISMLLSNLSDASVVHEIGSKIFNQLSTTFKGLSGHKLNLESSQNVSNFYGMLNNYFRSINQDFVKLKHTHIVSFLQSTMSHLPSEHKVPVKAMAGLISTVHEINSTNVNVSTIKELEEHISILKTSKELNDSAMKVVYYLIIVHYNKKTLIDSLGETFLKQASFFKMIFKYIKPAVRKNEFLDNYLVSKIVVSAMQVISNYKENKEKLLTHYPHVYILILLFFDLENLSTEKFVDILNARVYNFTIAILAFSKVGLNFQALQLARLVIVSLRKLDFSFDPPSNLKNNVLCILNSFVNSSPPVNFSFECLTYLLALTQETNPLFNIPDKFKYWCSLKLQPFNGVKGITAFDIIKLDSNKVLHETVVEHLEEWPFCTVSHLDYENLLLLEIQSYLKNKQLLDCVLPVYKVAVAEVRCKITLARIVCCTTKSVIENSGEIATISKFHKSLHNMIKIISSNKNGQVDEINKMLVLGDLNYWLARCEIHTQRTIAQTRVVNPKEGASAIPTIEDSLNSTILLNEFSFIAYNTQEKVMLYLSQALEAWNQSLVLLQNLEANELKSYEFGVSCSLKYIKESGYIYKLYKDVKREAAIWQLMYDLGETFDIPKYRIIGFAELLCILVCVDKECVNKMMAYVKTQQNIEDRYYYNLFYIAVGKHLLFNLKYEESKEVLEKLNEVKLRSLRLVYIQYGLYSYWLRSVLGVPDHRRPRELVRLFEICLGQSNKASRTFVEETVGNCLLFDLALMIGRLFCKVKDARYARLYSSKQLEMTQGLHLPIRTCELLTLQAEIDLLCANPTEVANKLSGIETILNLSHSGITYNMHPEKCTCLPCGHVEYQVALVYTILLKTGMFRVQQASTNCLNLLKECRELVSKMKKKFNRNYLSEFLDCDIAFNITTVEVLVDWGKVDKALKYADLAVGYIKRNYKPCRSELSTLSFITTLKFQFALSKLSSSILTSVYLDDDLDSSKTPQMAHNIASPLPLPIGWKNFSPNTDKIFCTSSVNINFKQLKFDNTPNDKKQTGNPESLILTKQIDKVSEVSSAVINVEKQETSTSSAKLFQDNEEEGKVQSFNIPTIVITPCADSKVKNKSPLTLEDKDKCLRVLNKNCGRKGPKKNSFFTPHKNSVPVFCDKANNLTKFKRKTRLTKSEPSPKNTGIDSKSIITVESDSENEETLCKTTFKTKASSKYSGPLEGTPFKTEISLSRKKLFLSDQNPDTESFSADSSILNQSLEDDEIKHISSQDETSIINATVYEEPASAVKLPFNSKLLVEKLENKFSNLCVTPTSPLAKPLARTTVKKSTRKAKSKVDTVSRKQNNYYEQKQALSPQSMNTSKLAAVYPDSTPKVKMTRSARRLLLSSSKVNRL